MIEALSKADLVQVSDNICPQKWSVEEVYVDFSSLIIAEPQLDDLYKGWRSSSLLQYSSSISNVQQSPRIKMTAKSLLNLLHFVIIINRGPWTVGLNNLQLQTIHKYKSKTKEDGSQQLI